MKIVMNKTIPHDKLGRLVKGQTYDTDEPRFQCLERWLPIWLGNGTCERYETKVLRDNPTLAAGAPVPLSASPAAQASPPKTSKKSDSGDKPKRGRRARS